jgi:hypothetical protein
MSAIDLSPTTTRSSLGVASHQELSELGMLEETESAFAKEPGTHLFV